MKTIVLTGGGTGGHVYPSLALLPKLKQFFNQIIFIGGDGMEKDVVARSGIPFYSVPTVKFSRSLSLENFAIPQKLKKAVNEARVLLQNISPDVVFSKGGYASLPTVIAARSLKIPVVCHESDLTLGLANKVGKALGATVACALPQTALKNKKYVFTGMPLRDELFNQNVTEAKAKICGKCGAENGKQPLPVLLVLGGSSGAVALNKVVYSALDMLLKKYFVVHISGKNGDETLTRKNYVQLPYTNQIELYYAAADVVLSRAGATAVAELSALNKKAVFVPLPKGSSRGDQIKNAELARDLGAKVVFQHDFNKDVLLDVLESVLNAPPMRSVSKNANDETVKLLITLASTNAETAEKAPNIIGKKTN